MFNIKTKFSVLAKCFQAYAEMSAIIFVEKNISVQSY